MHYADVAITVHIAKGLAPHCRRQQQRAAQRPRQYERMNVREQLVAQPATG